MGPEERVDPILFAPFPPDGDVFKEEACDGGALLAHSDEGPQGCLPWGS